MPTLVIIGGGPAGLSAAIYAVRAGLDVHVLYKDDGALGKADRIENYFGFPDVIPGAELLARGQAQADRLGARLHRTEVTGIEYADRGFAVKTTGGERHADAVLLATGSPRAVPAITGIRTFEGRGVSYCAVCDAFFYRGKDVAVLGNGAYALHEIGDLSGVVKSITLLTNGFEPNGDFGNIKIITDPIYSLYGENRLSGVKFKDGSSLPVSGLFIALGSAAASDLAKKVGAPVEGNSIKVGADMSTGLPGLFAAGDCTGGLLQVSVAVGEGAKAAMNAIKFVKSSGGRNGN